MVSLTQMILSVAKPSGLWESFIFALQNGIVNYGWTIIVFTIIIKLILSPMDFYIKYSSKKTTLVQQKLAPQMQKLQKKYGNNQQQLQLQMNQLYKKEGFSMVGSCVTMLVNLILSMVIFLTIYNGLRNISAYNVLNQYNMLHSAYYQTYYQELEISNYQDLTAEELQEILETKTDEEKNNAATLAANQVKQTYTQTKQSWLWVKNIWRPDTTTSVMPTYRDLASIVNSSKVSSYKQYYNQINETEYNQIRTIVESQDSGANGYFILIILAGVLAFLTQYVSEKMSKAKLPKGMQEPQSQQKGMMLIMKILMPIIMISFVWSSSAAFGIYVVTGSIISLLISIVTSLIVNKLTAKKEQEVVEFLVKQQTKEMKKLNKA